MQKNTSIFIITLTYFIISNQASISIESYFQDACGSTVTYDISLNNEYFVQNANLVICSNITIQAAIANTSFILKLTTVFFDIESDSSLTLIGCSITFVYPTLTNGVAFFNVRNNSSLHLKVFLLI